VQRHRPVDRPDTIKFGTVLSIEVTVSKLPEGYDIGGTAVHAATRVVGQSQCFPVGTGVYRRGATAVSRPLPGVS
jgi:hypothetical protein